MKGSIAVFVIISEYDASAYDREYGGLASDLEAASLAFTPTTLAKRGWSAAKHAI